MEKVILTNMCMVYDKNADAVVLENRVKSWPGLAFPGGHVEKGEALVPSVIREIKEETGLDITNVKLVGVRDWYDVRTNERTVVFLFATSTYQGTLIDGTEEGKVMWVKRETLKDLEFAHGFKDQLDLFFKGSFTEVFATNESGEWEYIFN